SRKLLELLRRHARRRLARGRQNRRGVVRIVAGARDVEGDPKKRRLDDLVLLERTRQLLLAETDQPSPQRDVRRLGPLRLNRAELLERLRDAELAPVEQQLTLEERAVQLPERENALGHSSRPKNEAEIAWKSAVA